MLREGDAAGARPLLERALRIYEKGYGPTHSKTTGTRADVEAAVAGAGVHVAAGRALAGRRVPGRH
jgi:hypothetical protein